MISSSSSCQLSTREVFADGGAKLRTDEQIRELIAERVATFKSGSSNESSHSHKRHFGSLQADCNVPSSSSDDVPKDLFNVFKQKLASAARQQYTPKTTLPKDRLKIIKADLTPSTDKEYSHVLKEVIATCATNEGKTPLVLTTISAETCPGLTEDHKSLLNGNKDLGNADAVPNVSVELLMQKKVTDPGVLQKDKMDINSNNAAVKTCEDKTCMIIKDAQYDDISEDENQSECLSSNEDLCIQNLAIDMPPPAKVPESTGDARFGLDQVQSKSILHKDLTDGDSGAVFASKYELNSLLTDTDDDDEWEIVPLSIFRLTFEEADDGACEGKTNESCSAQKTASAFSQMEVFDTPAEQELAVKFGQVSFVVPSYSSNHEQMSQMLRRKKELCSEPEDSCDTDNGSAYSSDSEGNYLTMSKQLVQNVSSALQVNIVKPEKKNQGNKAKKWQKSSIQEVINLDSDDESDEDCVKKTESSERCHPHSENSWTNAANEHKIPYLQPLKGSTVYPSAVHPPGESSQLSRGTENGLCVINEVSSQNISNTIIIVSDSDDDSMEMFTMRPHSEPVDLTDKENFKDPKQSSAEQSESNSKSNWDKDVSNRPIRPGKTSFCESSTEKKDLTKKRILSPERVDSDNLNDAGNGLCTKRKKVRTSEAGSSMDLGLVIPRLLVQLSPHSSEHIQLVHESGCESRDKDLFTPNSFREKTVCVNGFGGKSSKVHNTRRLKLNRASFGQKKGAPSPKHLHYTQPLPYAPDPLKKGRLSVDQTNHARNKVFNDWQRNHVPLRRERKATQRKNDRRHTL